MTASYNNGSLMVRHGSTVLAMHPVAAPNPRALVERTNAIVRGATVTGGDWLAWRARRALAEAALAEVLDKKLDK